MFFSSYVILKCLTQLCKSNAKSTSFFQTFPLLVPTERDRIWKSLTTTLFYIQDNIIQFIQISFDVDSVLEYFKENVFSCNWATFLMYYTMYECLHMILKMPFIKI